MNLAILLSMAADGLGDRIAIGSRPGGTTYEELRADAIGLSISLSEQGGSYAVFLGINSPSVATALFASAFAGIPFVPLNYRLKNDQLTALLERTTPATAITDSAMAQRIEGVHGIDIMASEDVVGRGGEGVSASAGVDPDAIAVLLFTSGTTGDPKAAILRHRHLTTYILETVDFMGAEEDECTLVSVPPYHIAGISAVLSSVYAGRRCIQLDQFDPQRWVSLARDEAVTHAMVVPTMLSRIVEVLEADGGTLPLRHLAYGGGRMPVDVIERALELLPDVDFVNAYGLTETSSTVALLAPDDHRAAFASEDPAVRARLASVGRPLESVELEVRDAAGVAVGPRVRGEIHVRGPQVSGQYVDGARLLDDNWFPTRDLGYLDESGYLHVEGRLDDVIVRGGENISPGEVEAVLASHPAVIDTAVVGIPNNEWGEVIAAVVVAEKGDGAHLAEELRTLVRQRLGSTRVPERIDFRASLPYSETGKLLRRNLRGELNAPNDAQADL